MKLILTAFLIILGVNAMANVELDGVVYNDNRMFVLYTVACTVDMDEDNISYTIYHNNPPVGHKWCLVTYRNTARYPATRIDDFNTKEEVTKYKERVETGVPLIGMKQPKIRMSYNEFVKWKEQQGFKEYDYKDMYLIGGKGEMEIMVVKRR